MKIQFFGDLSLDGVYCDPQQHQILKDNMTWLDEQLGSSDLRIVNWESPLWGSGNVNKNKFPRLCTTRYAAEAMAPLKLDLALVANNHVFDNCIDGFRNTLDYFNDFNIKYIGAGFTEIDSRKPFIYTKDGVSVGILNFVGDETNPNIPESSGIFVNSLKEEVLIEQILECKNNVDHVIVTLHWGEEEFLRVPHPVQRELAEKIINAGASAVIGAHVHCLQGWEKKGNGVIAYSLGNFIFGPQLVIPGEVHSDRFKDNNKIGIIELSIFKENIVANWKYFSRDLRGLTLKLDEKKKVESFHKQLSKKIICTNKQLLYKYKKEKIFAPIRNFCDKNGGFFKAILSIRVKQLKLLTKIFK